MLGRDSQARPTSATSAAQGPGGPRTARPAWRCPGYRFGPCCADQTAAPEWIAKYREGGLAAISAKIASGRPTALDDSEMIRLHAMISGADPGVRNGIVVPGADPGHDKAGLLRRCPEIVRGFFGDPKLNYIHA